MLETKRPLKVFLCHAHSDAAAVRALYLRLRREGVDVWLDKEKLLPGSDWELEIRRAVREADVVVVCLSQQFNQAGFRQKEVKIALDTAMDQPEGEIFIIPARLEECENLESLMKWHWVDLFEADGFQRLIRALRARADRIGATLRIHRSGQSITSRPKSKESEQMTDAHVSSMDIGGTVTDIETRSTPEQEKIEREAVEKSMREKAAREATEKAELEKSEKAAQQKLEREAAEKARKEKAEREAAEKALREKAKRDAAEKARRERAERRAAQLATLKETFSKFIKSFRLAVPKAKPFLRIAGIVGILFVLFWVGSRAVPPFLSLIPTTKASVIPLPTRPTSTIALSSSPIPFTKTVVPSATPTKLTTPNPTDLPTEITDAKGVTMRLVRAGEFTMGTDTYRGPAHQVYLDAYYMDKFEVTNALYKACVDTGVCDPPKSTGSSYRFIYYGNSEFDNYPVIHVDWSQAQTYCEWRDGSLPTEAQWEKAARGTDGRTYPWGEGIDCNKASYYADGNSCNFTFDTTEVGSYSRGASPYGIYDMAGNVWEWTADWYSDTYYQNSPSTNPPGPDSGKYRVLRGGSWYEYHMRAFERQAGIPVASGYDTGFRCARNANP